MKYGIRVLEPGSLEEKWLRCPRVDLTSMNRNPVLEIFLFSDINAAFTQCEEYTNRWSPTFKYRVMEMLDDFLIDH